MGFMDWISPALTPITQGVVGYQQGVQQKQKRQQDEQLQMIELLRERQQDADRQAAAAAQGKYQEAQIANMESEAGYRKEQAATARINAEKDKRNEQWAKNWLLRNDPQNPQLQGDTDPNDASRGGYVAAMQDVIKTKQMKAHDDAVAAREDARDARTYQRQKEIAAMGNRQQWEMSGYTNAEGVPYLKESHSGQLRLATGADFRKAGGAGGGSQSLASTPPSSADLGNAMRNFAEAHSALKAKGIKPGMLMQQREQLDINPIGTGKPATMKEVLTAGGLDALGFGAGSQGFDDYHRLMNASRQFGEEANKLFGSRAGYQQTKLQIQAATLTPRDFSNPAVIADKWQRMQVLYRKAQELEKRGGYVSDTGPAPELGGQPSVVPTTPTTGTTRETAAQRTERLIREAGGTP